MKWKEMPIMRIDAYNQVAQLYKTTKAGKVTAASSVTQIDQNAAYRQDGGLAQQMQIAGKLIAVFWRRERARRSGLVFDGHQFTAVVYEKVHAGLPPFAVQKRMLRSAEGQPVRSFRLSGVPCESFRNVG